MQTTRNILAAAAAIIAAFNCAAGSESELLQQIVANNLELKAAKMELESNSLSTKSENNLSDPEFEIEYMPKSGNMEMTLSESFEWPGVYNARKKVSQSKISALEYLYESKKVEIIKQARIAYADLSNINRRIAGQKTIQALISTLLEHTGRQENERNYTILDITKLKIDAIEISATLKELETERAAVIETIRALNGGIDLAEIDFFEETAERHLSELNHYMESYRNSPEAKAMRQLEEASERELKMVKLENLPNLSIGYKFTREDNVNSHGATFGLSIPMFSVRHKTNAAKANQLASSFSRLQSECKMEAEVKALYLELCSLHSLIAEYEAAIDRDEVGTYLKKAFEERAITLSDYLYETKYITDFQDKIYELKYRFDLRYAELAKYELAF